MPNDTPILGGPTLNGRILYDRFGRTLDVGDVLFLIGKDDVMWQVVDLKPILTPQAPPGAQVITLAATLQLPVLGGQPLNDVLKVLDAKQTAGRTAGGAAGSGGGES